MLPAGRYLSEMTMLVENKVAFYCRMELYVKNWIKPTNSLLKIKALTLFHDVLLFEVRIELCHKQPTEMLFYSPMAAESGNVKDA